MNLKKWLRKHTGGCQRCQAAPSMFLTDERIPICGEHWVELCETNIEWVGERK